MKRIHLIAVGGAAMHNLALALHQKGYVVTGSDDEIFEPSRSRLAGKGLLPAADGWHPERIHGDLDAVIVGMHARLDNPELRQAQQLGVKIYSFPEFLYEQTQLKRRVVVGGSHGKTTITGMILHVLQAEGIRFDYLVGAQLEGFETMVGLSEESGIAVFEGDEYLSSPLDRRPKFHLYRPHLALVSGIAWDHMNVFSTRQCYIDQFKKFVALIEDDGVLVFNEEDPAVVRLTAHLKGTVRQVSYSAHPHIVKSGRCLLLTDEGEIPLGIFGRHNMQNISGALAVCQELGVSASHFYRSISTFQGAARRLQLIGEGKETSVFHDFAHAPSKVKASVDAVKTTYPGRRLVACLELHTFSSLNVEFIREYTGTLDSADVAVVYFDPDVVNRKQLKPLTCEEVKSAFNRDELIVLTRPEEVEACFAGRSWTGHSLLFMSSGTFSGLDLEKLALEMTGSEQCSG